MLSRASTEIHVILSHRLTFTRISAVPYKNPKYLRHKGEISGFPNYLSKEENFSSLIYYLRVKLFS